MPFVKEQAKESLNYQINVLVLLAVLGPISVIMAFLTLGLVLIPAGAAFVVMAFVLPIIAAMKANSGEAYRYPLIIRVIS
jgi:uncharacterized Tic20 family protein